MKLFLAVFGKAGSPFVSDEVARYVKRLKGSASPLEIVELKESKRDDKLKALAEEAELFEKRFPKKDFVRAILSEEGKLMATVPLARWIEQKSASNIVFLIGSAYGIDEKLKAENEKVSADYKSAPEKVIGFIVGYVMKNTQGKANSVVVKELIPSIFD